MPTTAKDFNKLPLTINLLHGEGFKNVNPCTGSVRRVYVKAYIKGQQTLRRSTKKTRANVDKYNGANPIWNTEMKFNLNQRKLLEQQDNDKEIIELVFEVKASSPLFLADKKLGEVRMPVKDLYYGVAAEEMMAWKSLRCPVVGGSRRRNNSAVYLSYRFGCHGDEVDYDKVAVVATASAPPLPLTALYEDS